MKVKSYALSDDPMNMTFKALRRARAFFLILVVLFTLMFFFGFATGNTTIMFVSGLGFAASSAQLNFYGIAEVRRELWFIEHRLGLPKVPEELEDVEAYDRWLKEYISSVCSGKRKTTKRSTGVDEETLRLMEERGGSFVRALALLYRTADPFNKERVERCFGEYFEAYRKWARGVENSAILD